MAAALHLAETGHGHPDMGRIRSYAKKHGCAVGDKAKKASDQDEGVVVRKGFNPVSKTWVDVKKAWTQEDGTVAIEGWVSTPDPDLEKDIVEPESFYGETFEEYYGRNAPLSSNHDTEGYPIGHLQKGVLVRDGVIFQEEYHPTDPAEFEFFDPNEKRSGWYARGVVNDERAARSVQKGNIGGFSWIGNLREYEPIAGGGRRYHYVSPLLESTVAAYPVNPKAVMRIAKAYGLQEDTMEDTQKNPPTNELKLEELLAGAAERAAAKEAEKLAAKGVVTADQLGDIIAQAMQKVVQQTAVQKAQAAPDSQESDVEEAEETVQKARPGVGRKGTVQGGASGNLREDNPIKYLITKARTPVQSGKRTLPGYTAFDPLDKDLLWKLTHKGMTQGMSNEPVDGDDFADAFSTL